MLQLNSLGVENFRCFRKSDVLVEFHPKMTVLVAKNGNGKSAILDAIRISLGTFSKAFEALSQSNISKADATLLPNRIETGKGACYPVRVFVNGMVDNCLTKWERSLQDVNGRTTSKLAKPISDYGKKLKRLVASDLDEVALPIIAYYGTGRLWADSGSGGIDAAYDFASEDRFAGYEDALTPNSIYAQVKRWMAYAFQVKVNPVECETRIGRLVAAQYSAVEHAVDAVLKGTGFKSPHYNFTYRDVAILQDSYTEEAADAGSIPVPVSHTSDGIKAAISLVADIAYRCVRLNPAYGAEACLRTQGVVLIDEVDLFLHPSWQQIILSELRTIFPEIQFVVTTHSPQVVSSVPRECLRIVSDGSVYMSNGPTQGIDVGDLLQQVFGTSPLPEQVEIVQKLERLRVLAAEGDEESSEWDALYQELCSYYGLTYGSLQGALKQRDFVARMKKRGRSHA